MVSFVPNALSGTLVIYWYLQIGARDMASGFMNMISLVVLHIKC
jgi:heme/copper-type cytochrome/quinol oxidase subunit 1